MFYICFYDHRSFQANFISLETIPAGFWYKLVHIGHYFYKIFMLPHAQFIDIAYI